jgi:hypothetical protein
MARRTIVAFMTFGVIAVLALPASAKGISWAHFTGPGLPPGGITVSGERANAPLWQTGVLETKSATASDLGMTRKDLGPAYRAVYRFSFAPGRTVRQVVYPYSPRGPSTYTPAGQELGANFGTLDAGWYYGSSELFGFLVKHGFPRHAPVVAAATSLRTSGSGSGWLWPIVVVGLAGMLLAGGWLNLKRRQKA